MHLTHTPNRLQSDRLHVLQGTKKRSGVYWISSIDEPVMTKLCFVGMCILGCNGSYQPLIHLHATTLGPFESTSGPSESTSGPSLSLNRPQVHLSFHTDLRYISLSVPTFACTLSAFSQVQLIPHLNSKSFYSLLLSILFLLQKSVFGSTLISIARGCAAAATWRWSSVVVAGHAHLRGHGLRLTLPALRYTGIGNVSGVLYAHQRPPACVLVCAPAASCLRPMTKIF